MRGISFPRHNRISIPLLTYRAGEAEWVMTTDIDNNRVPKRIKIVGIAVKPSIATIRAVRLYSKATRVNDAGDADFSLIYEDNWSDFTVATNEHSFINPDKIYIDDDISGEILGTIYGTIEIKALSPNSAFMIDIDYFDM